jgi:hypothetical protein
MGQNAAFLELSLLRRGDLSVSGFLQLKFLLILIPIGGQATVFLLVL